MGYSCHRFKSTSAGEASREGAQGSALPRSTHPTVRDSHGQGQPRSGQGTSSSLSQCSEEVPRDRAGGRGRGTANSPRDSMSGKLTV